MGVQIRPAPLPQFQLDPDFKESFNKKELQLHPKFKLPPQFSSSDHHLEEGKADQEGKKGGWKENERDQGEKEMLSFTWMPFVLLLTVTSMGWPQDRNTQGDRECRNACGWIKYQQQGGWAATGVQRNTFCECPSSTECRYSHTD